MTRGLTRVPPQMKPPVAESMMAAIQGNSPKAVRAEPVAVVILIPRDLIRSGLDTPHPVRGAAVGAAVVGAGVVVVVVVDTGIGWVQHT